MRKLAEFKPLELDELVRAGWQEALSRWGSPSIPLIKVACDEQDFARLGDAGRDLAKEFEFMQYPAFQTYANLLKIDASFPDLDRGYRAIVRHGVGHRHCPYDLVTALFLARRAQAALDSAKLDKGSVPSILNLFTDECINTHLVRTGDTDIAWAYQEISKHEKSQASPVWRVYAGSMERLWNTAILPPEATVSADERKAGEKIALLFADRNPLDKQWWESVIGEYAVALAPFFEKEQQNKKEGKSKGGGGDGKNDHNDHRHDGSCPMLDQCGAKSIPTPAQIKELLPEIARRIAKPGSDGLPTNPQAVKEFCELLAGIGEGDPRTASLQFYEQLASRYTVKFATRPLGMPRTSPFSVQQWTPSDPISALDAQHSVMTGGVLIPGVTTKQWHSRTSTVKGGELEVVPTLDLLLDSSESMPDPTEVVSLPVLAGCVAARRAIPYGVRCVNYSAKPVVQERTTDLRAVYDNLMLYQKGGTVFPISEFLANPEDDPRLSLIITDTFLANMKEAIDAIKMLRARNKQNRVTIYAITALPNVAELVKAGAEVLHGTTPNIFKHIIGKTEKVYLR